MSRYSFEERSPFDKYQRLTRYASLALGVASVLTIGSLEMNVAQRM